MSYTILLIDDNESMCLSLKDVLSSEGVDIYYTTNPCDAEGIIERNVVDLVISDVRMPGMGGLDLLRVIKEKDRTIDVIMITGFPTIDNAIRAMKYGAANFYVKPLKLDELKNEILQLCSSRRKKNMSTAKSSGGIVFTSPQMQKILATAAKAAPTNAPILVTGESGTGKEKIAEFIKDKSKRKGGPFIKINCAAIPESLLESELFGHEKGAFTNAVERKIGKFEAADGGTIFLDEIGDMSLKTQAKILRLIQEQEFERVGGVETIRVDVRLIAATNKNIRTLIDESEFREDLYYRLSVIMINLPPLRERTGDVSLLLSHFIGYFNGVYDKSVRGCSEDARRLLLAHDWPGNVRELRNTVERAVIFCDNEQITTEELPAQYSDLKDYSDSRNLDDVVDAFNRDAIKRALNETGGVKNKAAEILNIDRRTLYNRMKKLGIQ